MKLFALLCMLFLVGCGGGGSAVPATPRTVVFLGDSVTTTSSHAPGVTPFPSLIPGIISINRGIGGNTSAQMLARLSECFVPLPQTLVLECGLNDIQNGVSLADYRSNVLDIVAQCHAHNVSIILCTVTPWADHAPEVDAYNATIRSLGVPVADLYAAFQGIPDLLEPDGEHPNQKGQNLIAATLAPLL